jgi:hypothetical protein
VNPVLRESANQIRATDRTNLMPPVSFLSRDL